MLKLQVIFSSLNFMTHKKSVAIYVSPAFEKILYLDMAVEQRIIIDDTFEIRELVLSKKHSPEYLVLLLGSRQYSMYVGNSSTLERILSNTMESLGIYRNAMPGLPFRQDSEEKAAMEKYLLHADNSMNIIRNAYPLPLFITGTENIIDQFRSLSKNAVTVLEYVYGNYEESTLEQLQGIFNPYISHWGKVVEKDLLNQLKEAKIKNKIAIGVKNVWREAMNHNGRLLVVEKNYRYAPARASVDDIIYKAVQPYNGFSYVKDAVGDMIEKVLESGGDVDFVDKGVLKDFQSIAMVKYY